MSELDRVREIGIEGVKRTENHFGFYVAAADIKYQNIFARDFGISVAQSLIPENRELYDLILPPSLVTMNMILEAQSGAQFLIPPVQLGDLRAIFNSEPLSTDFSRYGLEHQNGFNIAGQIFPGMDPHEIHNVCTPTKRRRELEAKGFKAQIDKNGNPMVVTYQADDVQALTQLAAGVIIEAMNLHYGPDVAKTQLETWWPALESSAIYDLNQGSRADGLLQTIPRSTDTPKKLFRTWRDGRGAFRDRNGQLPKPPYTFFANNCYEIAALEEMEKLARMQGEDGWVEILLKRRNRMIQSLHERFWMEDEKCFAMLLDGDDKPLKVVSNEGAIGIFTGALHPEYAERVANRHLKDDLLTPYGTRLVSLAEPDKVKDLFELYQRSPAVWPHMDTQYFLGCILRYNLTQQADVVKAGTYRNILEFWSQELRIVDVNGVSWEYLEHGKPVASKFHAFTAHGVTGVTGVDRVRSLATAA